MGAEDYVLVASVTLASAYQLVGFARRVGQARGKFKVVPPITTGDPEFDRTFRAQQNTLEFFPIFLICMWVASAYFHQLPACILGLYYLFGRYQYFNGYVQSEERRLPGFYKCTKSLRYMLYLGATGLAHAFLAEYLGLNIMYYFYSLLSAIRGVFSA